MKKILFLLALCALAPFAAFSQSSMSIDSVVVRPANPTANDSVWLHIYAYSLYSTNLNGAIFVTHSGLTHQVQACYTVGIAAVITYVHDSVFVFKGPAGMHTISWTVHQNAVQTGSLCDLLVGSGQEQVNVTAVTGINDLTRSTGSLTWNAALEEMNCNADGMLSVYSVNGQLLLRRKVSAGTTVPLPETASSIVIAVLDQENGNAGRLRFYCGQ